MMIAPGTTVQKESMFRNGNAMSRAPICRGIRKLPKPLTGSSESRKKTMIVPCMVNNDT